jgi:hypothetical protein
MAKTARVKSLDALQSMAAALEVFRDDARGALDDLEMEIRRAVQWISEDCREYWKQEVRRGWNRVTEAKLQLEHAETFRRMEGQHSPCVEEQRALARAKQRLELAESKVKIIAYWVATVERAVNEYRAIRTHVSNWLDADFPKAVALLGRMTEALEAYVRLQAPADEHNLIMRALMAATVEHQPEEVAGNPEPSESLPEPNKSLPEPNKSPPERSEGSPVPPNQPDSSLRSE